MNFDQVAESENESFDLPITPLQSPSPYTHPIHIRHCEVQVTNGDVSGLVIEKEQLSMRCGNGKQSMAFYRGGGREAMKMFSTGKLLKTSEDSSEEEIEDEEEHTNHELLTLRPEMYEGETLALEKLLVHGQQPVIIHGSAIAKKDGFELTLIGDFPMVQFREFDCSSVVVNANGPFYMGIGSCRELGERHSFTFFPQPHVPINGQCFVDTSLVLDNHFSFSIRPTHQEGQNFSFYHVLSNRMIFECHFAPRNRATKYDSVRRGSSVPLQEHCQEKRDKFNDLEPLPYVDPLKPPEKRKSLRIRDKKKRLQDKDILAYLASRKRQIYGY